MDIRVSPPNFGPEPAGIDDAVGRALGRLPQQGPPDPYAALGNDRLALQLLTDTRKFCDPGREAFEWGWWRNIMYFLGRQWIYWNPSSRTWNDKRLAKWVPKPVTNKVQETHDAIFSILSGITPSVTARPVGQSPANVIAAQTTDEIAPLVHDEHDMTNVMEGGDFWAILLGNAYLHPHWDKDDPSNRQEIDLWQCGVCKTVFPPDVIVAAQSRCPVCNAQAWAPAMGPDGAPLKQTVTGGKGRTLVVSPLELLLPLYAQAFDAVDRLVFTTWLPRHQIEEMAIDPATLRRVQWNHSPEQKSLQLYRSLALQSDLPVSPAMWNTSATTETEGATVQHLWVKAGRKYEQGVYLQFVGEGDGAIINRAASEQQAEGQGASPDAANAGARPEIPYKSQDGMALWPWIHYPYKKTRGRLYARSAVDVILQKQDQVNQIDSMTQLVANRMGNPIWLEQKGSEVERFTGEPGLVVRWQAVGTNPSPPQRIAGENPPQSFFALRQQFLADIEDLAGTYDVVKGSKPSGVEAFSALQLLVERSQSRFTPTFKARGEAYRKWFEVAIELERVYGPDERVQNLLGPNRTWTQQTFERTKLQGSIAISIEDGSNAPKTALGRRAAIEHANQLGLLTPQANPDQLYALMQELGVSSLTPSLDADVKSALQEQQAIEDWFAGGMQGPMPLIRMPWHNDLVHLNENRKWMNGDAVREMLAQAGPRAMEIVEGLGMHLQEHQMAMMSLQMAEQGAQQGMQPPGTPPGSPGAPPQAGAGRAMGDSNRQSGNPSPPQAGGA